MDFTGTFDRITYDISIKKQMISFLIKENASATYEKLKGQEVRITVKKYRKKRSLDANAYYWALVGKISERLNSSKEEVHNLLLARYGQVDLDENGQAIIFSLRADIDISKRYDIHAKPIGCSIAEGERYIQYALLKGSHLYDTKEMAALIDGTISEAKELEIETLPPHEVERMKQEWGVSIEKENKSAAV